MQEYPARRTKNNSTFLSNKSRDGVDEGKVLHPEYRDFVILRHLMLEATVNRLDNSIGKFRLYHLDISSKSVILNKKPFDWDLARIGPTTFHIIKDQKSFSAEILETDFDKKTVIVKINQSRYQVSFKTKLDLLLRDMGLQTEGVSKLNHLRAPMPGLILEVMIKSGDKVKKGDSLLILEAMKMENVIKAPGEAIIKEIKVSKGDGVEKNQVLIQF